MGKQTGEESESRKYFERKKKDKTDCIIALLVRTNNFKQFL